MKRFISILLALVMTTSMMSTAVLAETITTDTVKVVGDSGEDNVLSVDGEESHSEQIFINDEDELSLEDIGFVTQIKINEDGTFKMQYQAFVDCTVYMVVYDEYTNKEYAKNEYSVSSATTEVTLDSGLDAWPEYFMIDVVLYNETGSGEVYQHIENSMQYEEIMNTPMDSPMFNGMTILDYGVDGEGVENFAVVSNDVNVVYVDSIDDVTVFDENNNVDSDVALMNAGAEELTYCLDDSSDVLSGVSTGDKVMIIPRDDVNAAQALVVEDKSEIDLFNDGEEEVALTADVTDTIEMEEFFDFVKLDIETSLTADDIVEPSEAEDEEEVELFGDFFWDGTNGVQGGNLKASKEFTIFDKNGCSLKDTISIDGQFHLTVIFKKAWSLKYISVIAAVPVTNKLKFEMKANTEIEIEKKLCTLYKKQLCSAVSVSIPLNVKFTGEVGASMSTTITQKTGMNVVVTYKNNTCTPVFTRHATSTTYNFNVKGFVTMGLGLGIVPKVTFSKFKAELEGYVTLKVYGDRFNSDNLSSVCRHNCDSCLDCSLSYELDAKLKSVSWKNKNLFKKLPKNIASGGGKIADFYASYDKSRNPVWKFGSGDCTNKSYKVVVKVMDSKSKKAIKDATVKYGSKTLGKTNKNGKVTGWLSTGTYKFKASKSKYNSSSSSKYVGKYGLNLDLKLTKSSAKEVYYVMDDLFALSDEEYEYLISDDTLIDNCMFRIESAEDLVRLAEFVNDTGRDTDKLRFVINNADSLIDLSEVDWIPIGTEENPFKGEFDGNSCVITGLTVSGSNDYVGLFGNVDSGEIFNLGVTNASVSGNNNVGIIAGATSNSSKIYNCYTTGRVNGSSNVAGISGTLNLSELANSYSSANVNGSSEVGGLVGIFGHSSEVGMLANSYSVGAINGSTNVGGVVGSVTYEEVVELATDESTDTSTGDTTEEVVEDVPMYGVQYCYYLDSSATSAFGTSEDNTTIVAFPISESQAKGTNYDAMIAQSDMIANEYTLLDALNNWYSIHGMNTAVETEDDSTTADESTTEETEDVVTVSTMSEATDGTTSDSSTTDETTEEETAITIALPDNYKKWFSDDSNVNSGYPLFEEKGEVYELTVDYLYEDGTSAFPSVVLYLTEGQAYDVDSYTLNGYYTDTIEYSGTMPAGDSSFIVYYYPETNNVSMKTLFTSFQNNGTNADTSNIYTIADSEDLIALSNYTNAGGLTSGITFSIINNVDMAGCEIVPIGTYANPFAGTINGDLNIISNLNVSSILDYSGLFGYTKNAVLNELNISDSSVSGKNYVGGLVGYADSTIILTPTVGVIVSGESNVGGIAGYALNSTIKYVVNSGSVTGVNNVGGIVGCLEKTEVTNSANSMVVTGTGLNIGGIVGETIDSSIVNSYTTANISGGSVVGGAIGKSTTSTIENVYNIGTVSAESVAGFVAEIDNEVKSGYYMNADVAVVTGSSKGIKKVDSAEILNTKLNDWVNDKAVADYYSWIYDSESNTYPVFGAVYDGWILNFTVDTTEVKFTYDSTFDVAGILYVATYDETGRLITIDSYTESGTYFIPSGSKVHSAKAFLWNADITPLDACKERIIN